MSTEATAGSERGLGSRYWRLFAASTISNLGDGVFAVALPLVAAELTRDPRAIALVALAASLPWLLFSLIAGALVDRWDRRVVMYVTDMARAGLVGVLAVAVAFDVHSMWMLYVIGFLLGMAETMFDNAAQTILPAMVRKEHLETANGNLFTAQTVTDEFVGPPLGGLLFAVAAALPFAVDAGSFFVAAVLVATIPGSYRSRSAETESRAGTGRSRSIWREIGEGLRWLRGNPLLLTLAILLGILNLSSAAAGSILVLFAQDILDLGDVGFGLLLAAGAAGSALGGVVASRLTGRFGQLKMLLVAAYGFGLFQLLQGFSSAALVFALLGAALGFLGVVWNVITVSLRQATIPDELLGRVNSVYRFLGWGGMPIGALLGGVLANAYSLRTPFIVGGLLVLTAAAIATPSLIRGMRTLESERRAAG